MINLDLFTHQLKKLTTWFDTILKPEEIEWLYESLTSKLDDEQFIVACQVIFDTKAKGYPGNFPAVKDFVEAVHGTIEDQALKQWSLVNNKLDNSSSHERYVLSKLGEKALNDIGGLEFLLQGQVSDRVWQEKRFLSAYVRVGRVFQRNEVARQLTGRSILELNGQLPKQLPPSTDD